MSFVDEISTKTFDDDIPGIRSSRLSVVVGHGAHGDFEVGGGLLLKLIRHRVNLETVEARHELVGGTLRSVVWMNHEEHVGETGAKIGAIGVVVAGGFRSVNIHALGTVQFHHRLAWNIGESDR